MVEPTLDEVSTTAAPIPRWLTAVASADIAAMAANARDCALLLGFSSLFQISVSPQASEVSVGLSTLGETWAEKYRHVQALREDPCVVHACREPLPAVIHPRGPYLERWFCDASHALGLAAFVVIPFYSRAGELIVSELGVSERASPRLSTSWLTSIIGDAYLLSHVAYHRHAAAQRALAPRRSIGAAGERDLECLALASLGLKCEDIADRLKISVHTVRYHFRQARRRLNSRTLPSAIAAAMQDPTIASTLQKHRDSLLRATL